MTMMEGAGYTAAVAMGVSLGLIGGGGSILTVPTLVYLMSVNPVLSTSYSLFVVGTTALAGSANYMRKQLVDYKTGVLFGIPSIAAVYLTRKFLMPLLPDVLFTVQGFTMTRDIFVLVLFAVLMVFASVSMIRSGNGAPRLPKEGPVPGLRYGLILLEGAVVGVLTGLVGAGGGFLIIPALVLLAGLPMKKAVGTSLLIIAAKSLIGFTGDLGSMPINWPFMLGFTALAIVGTFIGSSMSRFVPDDKLKPIFGWFVLVMGGYILVKELMLR